MTDAPILIIPDIHQDADFLQASLEGGRKAKAREVILLGDILDSRDPRTQSTESAVRTLQILEDLLLRQSTPVTLLWGNHDWKYWRHRELLGSTLESLGVDGFVQAAIEDLSLRTMRALSGHLRGGLTYSRMGTIWGEHAQLAALRHGYLLTHAGVHPQFWPPGVPPEEAVRILNSRMDSIVRHPAFSHPSDLTQPGRARGGNQPTGGPLWLDWDLEFEDALPLPQIVGHTPNPKGARQKGNSLCLDAAQTAYGLLHPDGSVEVGDPDSWNS